LLSPTTFIFQTLDDKRVWFQKEAPKNFPKIVLEDSIFDFYPYAEIYLKDLVGMVPDYLFFVEGLDFNIQLGNNDDGFMSANYCWSEHQISDTQAAENLAGTSIFVMISSYMGKDKFFYRSWDDTILNVVKEIIQKDYNLKDTTKIFYSLNTTGVFQHNQYNETNRDFLILLSNKAYTQNFPKSSFFTFFNCLNEFYFMSLSELFNQTSVAKYTLLFDEKRTRNPNAIQKITFAVPGMVINKKNYEQDAYYLSSSGSYTKENLKLEDYLLGKKNEKFLLQKQKQRKIRNTYLGLIDNKEEKAFKSGVINNLFLESMLPVRLEITTFFNPKVTSGKTIDIEINSGTRKNEKMSELSGKWLVCQASHYMDTDGVPFSQLEIAKTGVNIDEANKYAKEFLG
jgi:hypothetical protein